MKEMEFVVVDKGKDNITYEVKNNDNTILRPLVEEIEKDGMVKTVSYYFEHPYLSNPKIHIEVAQGKPQAALKRSLRRIEKVFETLSDKYKKAST